MGFRLTITDDEGVLIGTVQLDGLKLDWTVDQKLVGELIEIEMGGDNVRACAALPIPTDQEA